MARLRRRRLPPQARRAQAGPPPPLRQGERGVQRQQQAGCGAVGGVGARSNDRIRTDERGRVHCCSSRAATGSSRRRPPPLHLSVSTRQQRDLLLLAFGAFARPEWLANAQSGGTPYDLAFHAGSRAQRRMPMPMTRKGLRRGTQTRRRGATGVLRQQARSPRGVVRDEGGSQLWHGAQEAVDARRVFGETLNHRRPNPVCRSRPSRPTSRHAHGHASRTRIRVAGPSSAPRSTASDVGVKSVCENILKAHLQLHTRPQPTRSRCDGVS